MKYYAHLHFAEETPQAEEGKVTGWSWSTASLVSELSELSHILETLPLPHFPPLKCWVSLEVSL